MVSHLWLSIKIRIYWLIITFPKGIAYSLWYQICMLLPLENKIVASAFKGMKYGDNTKYICEAVHTYNCQTQICWFKNPSSHYDTPKWITTIDDTRSFRSIYHLATAKVVIDTHHFRESCKKRKGQLFVETWHGGLGIKKLELEVPEFQEISWIKAMVQHTNEVTDVFLSQSDHLSSIYRSAFDYKGPIFKCGFPKNDILIHPDRIYRDLVRDYFGLKRDMNLFLYVPTFRSSFYDKLDFSCYFHDYDILCDALELRFGGKWKILVRWHPVFADLLSDSFANTSNNVIDATSFADIQKLLLGVDCVLSDYSSCIFDAALLDIPCFTFAIDFEEYKTQRGVYYQMEELPFPYACTSEGLMKNIENYDHEAYLKRWYAFKDRMGLYEPGNASEVIAEKIVEFIETGMTKWE